MGRAALDWTTEQLAEASGISRATINRFERGIIKPTQANLAAVRAALERGGIEFLSDDGARLLKQP